MDGQRPVQLDQPGGGDRGRRDAGEKVRRQRRIGVLEREMDGHDPKIGAAHGIGKRFGPAAAETSLFGPKTGPAIGCRACAASGKPSRNSGRPFGPQF